MLGERPEASIAEFWKHCATLEEWKHHPALTDDHIPKESGFLSIENESPQHKKET